MTNYLGIEIDIRRDSLLDDFAVATMKDRYMYSGPLHSVGREYQGTVVREVSPQHAFARASLFAATYRGKTDYELAQRLYDGCSQLHFGWATPILSNGGTARGLGISCFLPFVPDSMVGITDYWAETAVLSARGGGLGAYYGALRTSGTSTSKGSKSNGMIPFLKVSDSMMFAVSQGTTRRGALAAYLHISHPEIEEFIQMRKVTGGDINRKCINLHHGVVIPDSFMEIIEARMESDAVNDDWPLIDPHTGETIKVVSAVALWEELLRLRHGAGRGEPFLVFGDTLAKGLPDAQRELGLTARQTNLCTEITLPTNAERTAVCCLSSMNVATFDEWRGSNIVEDVIVALDNVLDHFIDSVVDVEEVELYGGPNVQMHHLEEQLRGEEQRPMLRAAFSALRERAIGLGQMGLHTYLQKRGAAVGSLEATSINHQVASIIALKAKQSSSKLAIERGCSYDMRSRGRRHSHLLAVAPTATNSIICGGVSAGIGPSLTNYYVHKTDSGSFVVKNKELDRVLKSVYDESEIDKVWGSIRDNDGSIQHLAGDGRISEQDLLLFRTAYELDQIDLVRMAAERQQYICQAQSFDVYFDPPPAEADQETHDSYTKYFHMAHFLSWKFGLKTMYYCRTRAARKADNVSVQYKVPEINTEECTACEG